MDNLTLPQVMDMLRERLDEAGSQKQLAAEFGVSTPYLHDVLHGRRLPADAVLDALGLERVVTYRKKEEADAARPA